MTSRPPEFVVSRRTPFGWYVVCGSSHGITRCTFGHQSQSSALQQFGAKKSTSGIPDYLTEAAENLDLFFAGELVDFSDTLIDLSSHGTETRFCEKVRAELKRIPYGQTVSYGELAERVGHTGAARAVGTVMSRNPVPIFLPCHRVLGSNQGLGGYSAAGGIQTKQRLLEMERRRVSESSHLKNTPAFS